MVPQSAIHRQKINFTQSSGGGRWVQIHSRWTSRPLQCACRLLTTSWHASEAGVPKAPSERVICFSTPGYVGHDCRACHVHVGQQCAVGMAWASSLSCLKYQRRDLMFSVSAHVPQCPNYRPLAYNRGPAQIKAGPGIHIQKPYNWAQGGLRQTARL